jgi:hypothetical protein
MVPGTGLTEKAARGGHYAADFPWIGLVRTAGLEPAQPFSRGILSPLRLPFRHVRAGRPLAVSQPGLARNMRHCQTAPLLEIYDRRGEVEARHTPDSAGYAIGRTVFRDAKPLDR